MDHSGDEPQLPEHPALQALTGVDAALDALQSANLWSLGDADLLRLREAQEHSLARLQANALATTREIDSRGAAVATGATSTASWLRGRLRMHPGAAKAEVSLAAALDGELAETGAALAAGRITVDQARSVTDAIDRLPRGVSPADRRAAESFLLGQATGFDPQALNRLGRHLVLRLDPEQGEALEREEARQHDRQEFTLVHQADGSYRVRGQFAPESGALLQAAVGAVSAPRPADDGTPDPRLAPQRRAEGLVELVGMALAAPDMPESGGEAVTMLVTAPKSALESAREAVPSGGPEAGHLDPGTLDAVLGRDHATLEDGTPLSPESARRLGCDAWLVAAIVESGEILDIGRMSRAVPRGIRRALVARDLGCAFPGCGMPPRWCHAHHIWHWADGGPTALWNLVLLCGRHHRAVHHAGWEVWLGPDGRPIFRPPRWVDPDRPLRPAWRPPELVGLPLRT